ncbi:MAG: rhodanese-like domain-containing protein [Gammaproteobacteria bacterium]|nr:rhodanese-like domain-containing protein [Gammaproteobacteria bacterium]
MFSIKELDAATLKAYLDEGKNIRLLDVRSIAEMGSGIIPNAEKLPLHTLPVRLNEIGNDDLCVLYCRSGARSAQGVGFMAAQGFDNVYNLRGGVIAWQQNGFSLVA